MNKTIKHFSIGEEFKNKVPMVGLVVKDAEAEETGKMIAMVSISMMYDGRLVEANIPLENVPDFKKHIIEIIKEASKLKPSKDTVKKILIEEKAK
jgi:hypothetical protein